MEKDNPDDCLLKVDVFRDTEVPQLFCDMEATKGLTGK